MPQAEGTPLPPRDARIAERWPPEIKQLVDNMLMLYPKTPNERPLSVKEVERKMGITLTERPLKPREPIFYSKQYVVSGTRYADPAFADQGAFGARYSITRNSPVGSRTQHLQLVTAPPQSGFCLDPYELAVYTGSTFVNNDTSPHAGRSTLAPGLCLGHVQLEQHEPLWRHRASASSWVRTETRPLARSSTSAA